MTLFQPFLELKMKQSLKSVQDHSIGMGLANSQLIAKSMQGRIKLCRSEKEFTSISFTLPFQEQEEDQIMEAKIPNFHLIKNWSENFKFESKFSKLKEHLLEHRVKTVRRLNLDMPSQVS